MLEQLTLIDYPELTLSLGDSLAKICQLLESGQELKVREAVCLMRQLELYGVKDPSILSLKMSKGCFIPKMGETSSMSSKRLPTLGMMVNGKYSIQGGFCPKIESGYSLSDILEEKVDPKYFLSQKAILFLKNRAKENKKKKRGFQARLIPDMEV